MNQITHVMKCAGEWALGLLYPGRCPVCDGIVRPRGERICLECVPKLKPVEAPWCIRCGRRLTEEGRYCGDCRAGRHRYFRGRSLYTYESAKGALYRFKYAGRQEYARFFGEQMAYYLGDFIRGVDPQGIVPIPLHPARMAKRGYNQAELLARVIGRQMGLTMYPDLLVRVKNTLPSKTLNPRERQNNLKKAFNIAGNDVKLKTILLVDDIYTTGATVDEAAGTLLEAGAECVCFVALACGEPHCTDTGGV